MEVRLGKQNNSCARNIKSDFFKIRIVKHFYISVNKWKSICQIPALWKVFPCALWSEVSVAQIQNIGSENWKLVGARALRDQCECLSFNNKHNDVW